MHALAILLILVGLIGHVTFWVTIVNRTHGVAWPRILIDALTAFCGLAIVGVPAALLALFWSRGTALPDSGWDATFAVAWGWIAISAAWAVGSAVEVAARWRQTGTRGNLLTNHTTELDVQRLTDEPLLAAGMPRLLGGLPYNQVVRPWFQEKQLLVPRLTPEQQGITIAHISDLHMSGRISPRYFAEVFERVNQWQPDIVAITGDLVERPPCMSWIPETLGRLAAKYGVFFVLGNHDLKVDSAALRQELGKAGLFDLGSRWTQVTIGATTLVLAGNEVPWFPPAADMDDAPVAGDRGRPLRVLLTHSPDQFGWASQRDFDLVLAGHCHGGQVRFPLLGAVLAPSLYGTRYVAGAFRREQTIMHVSRGVSGMTPFRFNCPPEVSLLRLRPAEGG